MYTFSSIKMVIIDVATLYLVLATFIASQRVYLLSQYLRLKVWDGCDRLHVNVALYWKFMLFVERST